MGQRVESRVCEYAACRGVRFTSGERLDGEIAGELEGHTVVPLGDSEEQRLSRNVLTKRHYDKATGACIGIESSKPPPYSTAKPFTSILVNTWAGAGNRIKILMRDTVEKTDRWRIFLMDKHDELVEMASGTELEITLCAAMLTAKKHNAWPKVATKLVPVTHHWFVKDNQEKVHHETEAGGVVTNMTGALFPKTTRLIPEGTMWDRMLLEGWSLVPLAEAGEQQILGNLEPARRRKRSRMG